MFICSYSLKFTKFRVGWLKIIFIIFMVSISIKQENKVAAVTKKKLKKKPFVSKYVNIFAKFGVVVELTDGIVTIVGISNISLNETIDIYYGGGEVLVCLVVSIEAKTIKAISLAHDSEIKPGQFAFCSGVLLSVPVGQQLLGRIVDPIGTIVDGGAPLLKEKGKIRNVEVISPTIVSHTPVNSPLETGLKVIDSLIPIGHGQRELIIGDSKIGKTSIGIDAILNQKHTDTLCIYVAIGQKRSSIVRIKNVLAKQNRLSSTIIVAAAASDTAAMQYIAPYSGVTMAEYFMELGLPVLIVYDDLSKHAVSYRQISSLLRKPSGREGFPGDVFYSHSRLLERACNLRNKGSITALPIIETIQGDVSAYIPTNVISITDGQVFLETELFANGIRPSVSPGLSVSRVGSAAQNNVLRKLAGPLKLELAQFREVETFSKLGFVLDDATRQLVNRGRRLTQLLVQKRYGAVSMDKLILLLSSALKGFLDPFDVTDIKLYESEFYNFYDRSVFKYPLENTLNRIKNNTIDNEVLEYLLWFYSAGFYNYMEEKNEKQKLEKQL